MVSYTTTPLFSIQEAMNSESSLHQVHPLQSQEKMNTALAKSSLSKTPTLNSAHTPALDINYEYNRLLLLLQNYRTSEHEYNQELQILLSIVKRFDPVYDNYYDSSLEDITNEMVALRKEENAKMQGIVTQMVAKHEELLQILTLSDLDEFLIRISTWGLKVSDVYDNYSKFYKLDINHSKSEVRIRRRPLVRVRYLNKFYSSLRDIVIQLNEKAYSAEVLSNIEVTIFRLGKCLENSRLVDEQEKKKCELNVNLSAAKDVKHLKPVCVNLKKQCFNSKEETFSCDLHYINQKEDTTLNFLKVDLVFITSTPIKQLAIVQKDIYGRSLLFAPMKKNEFAFAKVNCENGTKSLLFIHSVLKHDVKLCFSFDSYTSEDLNSRLLEFFPEQLQPTYTQSTIGLGLKTAKEKSPKQTENLNLNSQMLPKTSLNGRSSNAPLYKLKFASTNSSLHLSDCLSRNVTSDVTAPLPRAKTTEQLALSKKLMEQIVSGETSDEESIISKTEELSFAPITNLPSPLDERPTSQNKTRPINAVDHEIEKQSLPIPKQTVLVASEQTETKPPNRKLNLEKYQNSMEQVHELRLKESQNNKKKSKSSFFGSLSNLLYKRQSKPTSNITNQKVVSKIPPAKEVSPTKSEYSISSVVSNKEGDEKLMKILSDATHVAKPLPFAKLSLWTSQTWTKAKNVKLFIHCLQNNSEFYLGVYDVLDKSDSCKTISSGETSVKNMHQTPLLFLKINKTTEFTFNSIDIHMRTDNHKDSNLLVLIRPLNNQGMKFIGNALVNPEGLDSLNSSESYKSGLTDGSAFSASASMSSIESVAEVIQSIKVETVPEVATPELTKSWTGVGTLNLIEETGKLKDLNRCVLSIDRRKKGDIVLDLTGFEFGNIELKLKIEQFKAISDVELMVIDKKSYIITFDSLQDLGFFNECVY